MKKRTIVSGNRRGGKSYMPPFIVQTEADLTGKPILLVSPNCVTTVAPREKDMLSCDHVRDLAAYPGSLFLCLTCVRMFCADCADTHEHATIPPRRPKTCTTTVL